MRRRPAGVAARRTRYGTGYLSMKAGGLGRWCQPRARVYWGVLALAFKKVGRLKGWNDRLRCSRGDEGIHKWA